jgi:hypothetical protein
MRELAQKCRAPSSLTDSPVQTVTIGEPAPIFQTSRAPSGIQAPLARSADPIVSAGPNPPQPRTPSALARSPVSPPASPSHLFALCALTVVTSLVFLKSLARMNFRLSGMARWTLDKLLRLGTCIAAVVSIPFFLLIALMTADDAGMYAFIAILGIGGLVALFSFWLTFGFEPSRTSDTGAVQPWSSIGLSALYAIGAAGWTVCGFYTILHFQ